MRTDIGAPLGERIILDKVLAVGSRDFTLLGRPLLPHGMVSVQATVVEKSLSRLTINQKFRKRENFRKLKFDRSSWTVLRINDIKMMRPIDWVNKTIVAEQLNVYKTNTFRMECVDV